VIEGRGALIMATSKAHGPTPPSNRKNLLDDVNRRILAELAADPRISTSELARRVGLSAPSVRERMTALTESGVIRGFTLDVDPAAVGMPVAAWVRVRPGPGQLPRIADLAARTPEVSECHRISGEDCFLMKVHAATIADLEPLLDRFLAHGHTTSSFVVSTPVPPRPVLPR
jgi:Lrp/AsnC family transcriptional regulator, leucine-responsive regulatory protein